VETTRGDRRAFALPLNSIVFSNAEYPAAVRIMAGPPWPDNVDYKKGFLLLLFRIEHGGVSKGLALRFIQPDRVQSDDVVYTKIFSKIVALRSR
jgi:hypothetical protein